MLDPGDGCTQQWSTYQRPHRHEQPEAQAQQNHQQLLTARALATHWFCSAT